MPEQEDKLLTMDGFDEAIIGTIETFGRPLLVCYDKDKVIELLMKSGIKTEDEAEEYFEYNILGAWVGEQTPCFLTRRISEEVKQWKN
jgi:hypothetical protein